jgi:hypothetical protein
MASASSTVLLWTTGLVAASVAFAAFLIWGTQGPLLLLDMIVAMCT